MNNITKIVTLRLTDELHKALKLKVLEKDTTIQQYLTDLITQDLNIISEKDKKIVKAALCDENNELCDYTMDMEKIDDANLTKDEKIVLEALLKISKMQNRRKK